MYHIHEGSGAAASEHQSVVEENLELSSHFHAPSAVEPDFILTYDEVEEPLRMLSLAGGSATLMWSSPAELCHKVLPCLEPLVVSLLC